MTLLREKLSSWFDDNRRIFPWRDPNITIFQNIITEILLQRTKAESVANMYHSFFKRFNTWDSLNRVHVTEIETHLKPLGIWRRRSLTLKRLAHVMVKQDGKFPTDRSEIDKLPGVGQYVGNAIEMFCHNRPMPLLDTNMARVLERVFKPRKLADIRHDPWLQSISKEIVSSENAVQLNWAFLDLGAMICTPRNPSCDQCPLASECNYFNN